MLVAAMLAMVLAAAAPALAQGDVGDVNQGDDQFNVGDETVYSAVCQNIIGAFQASAGQDAAAVADATAGDNAAAVAEIAQAQDGVVPPGARARGAAALLLGGAPVARGFFRQRNNPSFWGGAPLRGSRLF